MSQEIIKPGARSYQLASGWRQLCWVGAVGCGLLGAGFLLIVTTARRPDAATVATLMGGVVLPCLLVATYFTAKALRAGASFNESRLHVQGFLLPAHWDLAKVTELRLREVVVQNSPAFVSINGGAVSTTLIARFRSGQEKRFVISRFADWPMLLADIEAATGCTPQAA